MPAICPELLDPTQANGGNQSKFYAAPTGADSVLTVNSRSVATGWSRVQIYRTNLESGKAVAPRSNTRATTRPTT